jgi:hypothetical protein
MSEEAEMANSLDDECRQNNEMQSEGKHAYCNISSHIWSSMPSSDGVMPSFITAILLSGQESALRSRG